ncbi:porin family protein [Cecembia rubra]|uniref:Outer membrane protein with beta-barrel domain n=1 Tax=Cecembia rubra TaxID=1485585 RepID=A0A2P8DNC7_9BACT|nr:porin family protein [Cecembia rubra]PSK98731.1 outer membrane protein with beta-barrel domain [Cecembia rubra]
MKKLLFTIAISLICLYSVAQDFSIGPKFGVSQSNIRVNGDGFSSGDEQIGYHLGVFVRMGGHSIFVQPEFLFTNTGGTIIKQSQGNDDGILETNFNRLDIPVMFGFKFAGFFRLQAGPIASILLDYRLEDALQIAQNVDYKSATLGYQAGIGLDVKNLILDFKYENSLGKIAKSVAGFETDQRLSQIVLSAGFRLF